MLSKKLTSLFLAILLLISNFGLAFNVHYCGEKIASVSSTFTAISTNKEVSSTNQKCCCVKELDEKDSCCKNKVLDLKKDTKDVIIKTFSFQINAPFVLVKSDELHFTKTDKIASKGNVTKYYCSPNAPPLFKLYQQYVFYA